jgi:cell division protein FtsB
VEEEKTLDTKRYLSFLIPLLSTLAIVVAFSLAITSRHTEWKMVLSKKEALEKELAQLRQRNLELHKLRDCLLYDPVQIEKEAREQLGYGLPEEVIYKNPGLTDADIQSAEPGIPHSESDSQTRGLGRMPDILLQKTGLIGFFVVIIVATVGFFCLTFLYENRRNAR